MQIVHILQRDGRRCERDAWRIDALVLAEHAPFNHRRANRHAVGVDHLEFDRAVRQQQMIAGVHAVSETREGGRDHTGLAERVARHDAQFASSVESDGSSTLEKTRANLRTTEILKNGHGPPGARRGTSHTCERRRMRVVRAMRKIKADDVGTCGDERVQYVVGVGRGAYCRDDLRLPHLD